MPQTGPPPLLMIGWDAAAASLIEQWTDDGTLPNLAALRARGAYGRLGSTADWLAGSVWPTFYTGTLPSEHGIYHFLQWRSEQVKLARPTADWLPACPFWRSLGPERRVVAIDLPMTYAPEPFHGVEVTGWATHDRLTDPACHPEPLARWVRNEVGSPVATSEPYGLLTTRALLRIRNRLLANVRYVTDLSEALIQREAANLYLVGFGATHTAGHKFWDETGVAHKVAQRDRDELGRALRDVYTECDRGLGRILAAAPADASVMVFALHGMGPNNNRTELMPAMLGRILGESRDPQKFGLLKHVRELVPAQFRHWVKRSLPDSIQDRLTAFWKTGGADWSTRRLVPECADLQGFIGINLKGRELQGIVEPGEEVDELCRKIELGLGTFVDGDTGEPVVELVKRGADLYPGGPGKGVLPDLIVRWAPSAVSGVRRIVSPEYGSIEWPTPGKSPDGRSGNHVGQGFLVAAGGGIAPGSIEGGHILDLAPTACAMIGVPPLPQMVGKSLFGTVDDRCVS